MCSGIMILVGSVELDSEFMQDSSIMNPSCDISEVTSPLTVVDIRPAS